jgi:hypothetical protein
MRTKVFLTSIAALFLATGTAHADDRKWESSFRRCQVWKTFAENSARPGVIFGNADEVWVDQGIATISLDLADILELQKHLPLLKKCNAFWQCVNDRDAGKVKHCYENDRRWR